MSFIFFRLLTNLNPRLGFHVHFGEGTKPDPEKQRQISRAKWVLISFVYVVCLNVFWSIFFNVVFFIRNQLVLCAQFLCLHSLIFRRYIWMLYQLCHELIESLFKYSLNLFSSYYNLKFGCDSVKFSQSFHKFIRLLRMSLNSFLFICLFHPQVTKVVNFTLWS